MADDGPKDTLGVLTGNTEKRRQHDRNQHGYIPSTWKCKECGHRHSLEGSHTQAGDYIPPGVCPVKLRARHPRQAELAKAGRRVAEQIRQLKLLKVLEDKMSVEEWTKVLEEMRERGEKFPKPY